MMIKGQVISGEFGKILIRQKSDQSLELGELLVSDAENNKTILQVFSLLYGSQISDKNLELISGLKLEEDNDLEFLDPKLRNYTLAYIKPLVTTSKNSFKLCKTLPSFFSSVREITAEDLKFISTPKNPLFVGKLRSGSKILDVDINLPGDEVFSHHILISATTGRGKSLDENEEVLIKQNDKFSINSIGELVNNNSNFKGSKVLSMNPKNYSTDFKKIIKFVKHKAPKFMYLVTTESGREVMVTKDHNLHILRNGKLKLLKTQEITKEDYLPLPLKINTKSNQKEIDIFELLKDNNKVYVSYNKKIINKLRSKEECVGLLSRFKKPSQRYKEFIIDKKKIKITDLISLLKKDLSYKDLKSIELTDRTNSIKLKAIYPITKEFLQLLGYYIAEGDCPNDNCFRISSSERLIVKHLKTILKKIGLNYSFIKKERKNKGVAVSSSIFTKLLKKLHIGTNSESKQLPTLFMNLSDKDLKELLKTYFEGDGGVDIETTTKSRRIKISTTTKSKKLASELGFALLRFGILARIKKRICRAYNTNHQGDVYYRVSISGKSDLKTFLSEIGFYSSRKNNILKDRFDYNENTNVNIIPVNPYDFKRLRLETKLIQKQFSSKLGYSQQIISLIESGKRRPSRELFNKSLLRFNNFKELKYLANFRWDEIKEIKKIRYNKKYVYDLTIKDNKTFLAGHGGLFVHNSNLTSVVLWDQIDKEYCGILVLDPHDEYYGRNKLGLKDHPQKEKVVYYTAKNPPPGCKTLKINLKLIKPHHFNGVIEFSDPQKQALNIYYREFGKKWIEMLILERKLESSSFKEDTLAVVKRQLLYLLDLEFTQGQLFCSGVFDLQAGESTIDDICSELEHSKTVIIDTSNFAGSVELLIGSLVSTELLNKYKSYKMKGQLDNKPVISIVLEEAPRVLGKDVLEKGSNIFATIAREGRKFKVGLTAITQLPSMIPREILANMNTKIILGIEMKPERQAIIESASQDLSEDDKNIASLDKGEAIITSNFTKFATPISIPFFDELVKKEQQNINIKKDFTGII